MTSSDDSPAYRLFRVLPLCLALGGIVLVAGFGLADRQLKNASHPGFLPQDMPVYFHSSDFPLSWLKFSQTPLAKNLQSEAAPVLNAIQLALRQLTGIRPTPSRWRTWLGNSVTGACNGRDWIICTHPGLVARLALSVHPEKSTGAPLHHAWREGYLFLSSDPTLIARALDAAPVVLELPENLAPDSLFLQFRDPATAAFTLSPEHSLPLHGRIRHSLPSTAPTTGDWPPPVLPGNPAILISFRNMQTLTDTFAFLSTLSLPDISGGILPEIISRWGLNRPFVPAPGPERAVSPVSCALFSIDTSSGVPLPALAARLASPHILSELASPSMAPHSTLPYEWNGCDGRMFPLFGDSFSLYFFQRNDIHFLATMEPLAALLAASPETSGPPCSGDLYLALDWEKTAAASTQIAQWAAARELLPETGGKDLANAAIPVLNALGKCGTLQATALWTQDLVEFNALLMAGPSMRNTP